MYVFQNDPKTVTKLIDLDIYSVTILDRHRVHFGLNVMQNCLNYCLHIMIN